MLWSDERIKEKTQSNSFYTSYYGWLCDQDAAVDLLKQMRDEYEALLKNMYGPDRTQEAILSMKEQEAVKRLQQTDPWLFVRKSKEVQ